MLVIIKIGEGYQPLPVGIAGTGTADGVVRRNIYFRRFGERISDTCAPLFVHSPVSGEIGEQKLEVEVLKHIINKHQLGFLHHVIPYKLVFEDVGVLSGNIGYRHDVPHEFPYKGLSGTPV